MERNSFTTMGRSGLQLYILQLNFALQCLQLSRNRILFLTAHIKQRTCFKSCLFLIIFFVFSEKKQTNKNKTPPAEARIFSHPFFLLARMRLREKVKPLGLISQLYQEVDFESCVGMCSPDKMLNSRFVLE